MSEFLSQFETYFTDPVLLSLFGIGLFVWMFSTTVGGGGPVIFLPVLSFFAPIREVAPITSVTAGMVSLHRIRLFYRHIDKRILLWLLPGSAAGATLGVHIFMSIGQEWLMPMLAAFLIVNALTMLIPKKEHCFHVRNWHFLIAGFFFAGVSAIVGAAGQGINALFINRDVAKEKMIATKAADAIVIQTIKINSYIHLAAIGKHVLLLGIAAGCGAMCGNYAGKWFLARISEEFFKRLTGVMLLLTGLLIFYRFLVLEGL